MLIMFKVKIFEPRAKDLRGSKTLIQTEIINIKGISDMGKSNTSSTPWPHPHPTHMNEQTRTKKRETKNEDHAFSCK